MKERPILFSGPMVRAILDGSKTQTRRVKRENTPQPGFGWAECLCREIDPADTPCVVCDARFGMCPYGDPGDCLWVRETFYVDTHPDGRLPKPKPADVDGNVYYRADGECCDQIPECSCAEVGKPRWRPSIFMPRWASRLTLDVLSIRVERVQAISDEDIIAEGVTYPVVEAMVGARATSAMTLHDCWRLGWTHINGAASWDANPYVWVVGFRRMETSR